MKSFYEQQGFIKIREDIDGNTLWEFTINDGYQKKQNVIEIIRSE